MRAMSSVLAVNLGTESGRLPDDCECYSTSRRRGAGGGDGPGQCIGAVDRTRRTGFPGRGKNPGPNSFTPVVYEPQVVAIWEEAYGRFKTIVTQATPF